MSTLCQTTPSLKPVAEYFKITRLTVLKSCVKVRVAI